MRGLRPILVLLLLTAQTAAADELLDRVLLAGESRNAGRQLDAARKFAAAKNWTEAVAQYQTLIENSGDELVPIDSEQAVSVRWLCHADLARLPDEARKTYRDRVNVQAARWLEQGTERQDRELLQRIVDNAFCSAFTPRALDLLGNMAFQRGEFLEARRWWQLLAGPLTQEHNKTPRTLELVYPEPPDNVAAVRAKLVLANLFQGDRQRFTKELQAFSTLHPKAEGSLAGRLGVFSETLKSLAESTSELAPPARSDIWSTFAGDPTRQHRIPDANADLHRLARMCKEGPRWRFNLEKRDVVNSTATASSLAFHPIIVGDQVLVNDGLRITAYGIRTGEAQTWYDLREDEKIKLPELQLPAKPYLRLTLTAAEGFIVGRLGAQAIGDEPGSGAPRTSFLVCLREKPNRKGQRLCWTVPSNKLDDKANEAYFEGSPVIRDGRVYAVATLLSGGEASSVLFCYALETDSETPIPPRLLWKQDLCTVKEDASGPRYRHHLLTLAGRNLIYASHSGAVAAVDAVTGKHAWARRYRSRGPNLAPDRPSRRDLGACLYAGEFIYVAPLDDNQLLCLDPTTGSVVWAKHEIEVVDLLGLADGQLILNATVMPGNTIGEAAETQMRAVDAATGDKFVWAQPGEGRGVKSFGRGILFGKHILWPTMEGVCVLQVDNGDSVYEPQIETIRRGNMVYVDGCLVVADLYGLSLYVSEARLKGEHEEKIKNDPDSPQALLRRAQEQVARKELTSAMESYLAVLAGPESVVEKSQGIGVPAAAEARRCLLELSKSDRRVGPALDQSAHRQLDVITSLKDSQLRMKLIGRANEVYPGSPGVAALLPELAAMHQKNAEWGAAARCHRMYLQQASETAPRADALAQLAVCYEKQHLWPAARSTWLQLAHEAGDVNMPQAISKEEKVRAYVEKHLKQPEFHPAKEIADTFAITWHTALSASERLLAGQSTQKDRTPDEWFTARNQFVNCREVNTGKIRWTIEMPAPPQTIEIPASPQWCGRYLDLAVLGGPETVLCLSIADGEVIWKVACTDARGRFSDFQLVGDRLYFLHGLDRLVAVDAVTGKVLWITSAPPGSQVLPERQAGFFPSFLATEKHVIINVELGGALILDAVDGTQLRRLWPASAPGKLGQPPTPFALGNGEKVCLALDLDHIIGFDLQNLTECWRYKLPFAANRTGAWPLCIKSRDGIAVGVPANFGLIEERLDPGTGKAISDKLRLVSGEDMVLHKAFSVDPPARQYNFRWLLLSVQCDCDPLNGDSTFSVVLHDDRTGKEAQRIAFHPQTRHWPMSLRFALDFSWQPQFGEAASAARPSVCRYADGLIVTLGKDAWRLSPKSTP